MNELDFSQAINGTVRELSRPGSYAMVCHQHRQGEPLPSSKNIKKIIDLIREIIFPGYFGNTSLRTETMQHYLGVYIDELCELLKGEILAGLCFECEDRSEEKLANNSDNAGETALEFIRRLPDIRRKMVSDVKAIYLGDPAAKSYGEVIFCYPAIKAITNYRIAHCLVELDVPLIPRYIAEMAHSETGIDIHPEARIGECFAIDHGTGVVIGSTCIIGDHVKIYQGVTLGAKSFDLDEQGNPVKGIPRHPVVEDNVIIYAGATILGRITIGRDSVIGGNVWVTKDLPAGSKIIQGKTKVTGFIDGAGI